MKKLKLFLSLLMLISFSVGNVWGAVVSGTTYVTNTSSFPSGWTKDVNSASSATQLVLYSGNFIQTDDFCQNGFTSIVVKARKYGGPSDTERIITVEWVPSNGDDPVVLGTLDPTTTTLTNKTLSSFTNTPTANTSGSIKIYCAAAASTKGDAVSEVTITYTAGTCGSSCTNTVTITKGAETNGTYTLSATSICGDGDGEDVTISDITPAAGYAFDEITTSASGTVDNVNKKVTGITAATTITVKFKELQKYTVSFSTGAGNPTQADIKEATAGAGIELPAGPTPSCSADGWVFAGWKETSAVAEQTTTAPTLLAAGANYKPADDCTLYAVYKRTESGAVEDASVTETFENQTAGTTYNSTQNYTAANSVAGLAWTMFFGTVSTNDKISGSNSAQMRWYGGDNVSKYGYIETKTAVSGLQSLDFKARVSSTDVKMSVWYSTDGTNWTASDENLTFSETGKGIAFSSTISGTVGTDYFIKIGVGNGGTAPSSANYKLIIDDIQFNYKAGSSTTYYLSAPTCCTKHTISIADGIQHGTVSADLAEACEGTTVTLTADPADDYRFASWSVNSGAVTVTNNQFTMPDANVTVSANFEEDVYAVTVTNPAHGTISVKDGDDAIGANVLVGKQLTVSIADVAGYRFALKYKVGEGEYIALENGGKITMPASAITITADETALYAVALAVNDANMGSATINGGAGPVYVDFADDVTLVATPKSGFEFVNWTVSTEDIEIDDATKANGAIATIGAAGTITANFKVSATPTLTVSTSEIDFGEISYKGELAAQSFTIEGANLKGSSISIEWEAESDEDAFDLSAIVVAINDGAANATITVTPRKDVCGDFLGQLNISTTGVATKNVTLALKVNKLAANLTWSADEATAVIGDENEYPTIVNPRGLENIVYSSLYEDVATVNATTGVVTELKKAGETMIIANFAGNDTIAALAEDALFYTLNVKQKYTAKWYLNGEVLSSQTAIEGTALNVPSDPTTLAEDCADMIFKGWTTAPIATKQDEAPEFVNFEGAKMPANDINYYAVFAVKGQTEVDGDPEWVEITTIPTAGTYAICTADYFMKAEISTNRFANGTAAPQITDGKLTVAPASDCQWEVSMNASDKFLFKNGSNYAAGNGTKNQGALITDATDTDAQWDISYSGGFVIENVGNKAAAVNYTLRNNTTYGWAAYGNTTGSAPRLFKLNIPKVPQTIYTNYVTTCPECTKVTLDKAAAANGSFILTQNGVEIATPVKTCDIAEVEVDATPATGYELTNVALAGVEGAAYAAGVITIPAEAEGTLTVTATFSQINYTVTLTQEGGAEAELENQENKHYNDVIELSAPAVDGYVFVKWSTTTPNVEFANANAAATTFTMPNSNVTVKATYAKLYTVAEASALADGTTNVAISGIVSEIKSIDPSKYTRAQYYISDNGKTDDQFQVYNGYYLYGADVTSLDQIVVGDKVLVYGNIGSHNDVTQVAQNNYLLSSSHLSSIAISGECKTAYEAAEEFDRTGLIATASWADESQKVVTTWATWTPASLAIKVSQNVDVTATWCGKTGNTTVAATLKPFASLEALVAADLDMSVDQEVTVSFFNVEITDIVMGELFLNVKDANEKNISIFVDGEVPDGWIVGGKLSGTAIVVLWMYDNDAEYYWFVPNNGWTGISYTKPEAPISWPNNEAVAYTVGKENTWQTLNNEKGLTVSYSSTTPAVATINAETGAITPLTEGTTTIKATYTEDLYLGKEVSYTLNVYAPKSLAISGECQTVYEAGDAFNRTGLIATATYSDDTNLDVTSEAEWTVDPATVSANGNIAVSAAWQGKNANKEVAVTVKTHKVTFADYDAENNVYLNVWNGETQISSGDEFVKGTTLTVEVILQYTVDDVLETLTANGVDIKASKQFTIGEEDVTVVATTERKPIAPISWSAASASITLNGDVATLPTLANEKGLAIRYMSNNEEAATIDENTGAITLVGLGETTITAQNVATEEGAYRTTFVQYTLTVTAAMYAVTFAAPANGTLVVKNAGVAIASGDKIEAGTTLTVEATPANGYVLAALTAGETDIKESKSFTVTADVEVAATFTRPYVALIGEMNGWDGSEANQLVPAENQLTASATFHLNLNENYGYGFKILVGSMGLSIENGSDWYHFHRAWTTAKVAYVNENSNPMWLEMDMEGDYTFTWNYADSTLTITFPEIPETKYYIAGDFTEWDENKVELDEATNGEWTASINLQGGKTMYFKIVSVQLAAKWYGLNGPSTMTYGNSTDWVVYEETSGSKDAIGLQTTTTAAYTFIYVPAENKISVVIPKDATAIDEVNADEQARKYMLNGQFFIERGGKVYDAQGQLVK